MTATEAAAALEEARPQQNATARTYPTTNAAPPKAKWGLIAQLLATTGGVYDPETGVVVQDPLTADAEDEPVQQLQDEQHRQEQETEAARRAALAPDVLRQALLGTLARTGLLDSLSEDERAGREPTTRVRPGGRTRLQRAARPRVRGRHRSSRGDRVMTGRPEELVVATWVEPTARGTRHETLTANGQIHVDYTPPLGESYFERFFESDVRFAVGVG
ncbi:hypothetical protein ABZ636_39255 [Streptomyces sp. NPDC007251]|uniref:hypothetical protein n=1 Tax=Streptomyces sp. NPDC007251 TaxID=3154483 RepID=UPI0034024483